MIRDCHRILKPGGSYVGIPILGIANRNYQSMLNWEVQKFVIDSARNERAEIYICTKAGDGT